MGGFVGVGGFVFIFCRCLGFLVLVFVIKYYFVVMYNLCFYVLICVSFN